MNSRRGLFPLIVVGLVGLVGVAQATEVSMQLIGPTSCTVAQPCLAGVYSSPYTALIDGTPTLIICDDFQTDVSIGDTWTATKTNVASLVNGLSTDVKFDTGNTATQQHDYAAAAW